MKRSIRHVAWAIAMALLATAGTSSCFAQVEVVNPNPLEPAGVGEPERIGGGSTLGTYHSGVEGPGTRLRSSGPGDNPAGLMLRELNGPKYYQGRGAQRIRGPSVAAARRAYRLSNQRQQLLDGSVYFARRGEYEDAIYHPRRGSYRYSARTTRTSNYRSGN
ncbi:MAG TPA: hypothetical protein VMV10_00690 [Pirellulales bacterium]|nr:hypothetical protein [Pirellulales bacterium]